MTLLRRSPDVVAGVLIAAMLVATAFLAGGATDLGANTTAQVGLVVIAAAAAIAVLVLGAPGRRWGAPAVLLFVALAALTYASIGWSVDPGSSWLEANRTLSYLAAFAAAAALARLFPGRWRAMVPAVATATTAVAAYALLVKVYPATLDSGEPQGLSAWSESCGRDRWRQRRPSRWSHCRRSVAGVRQPVTWDSGIRPESTHMRF